MFKRVIETSEHKASKCYPGDKVLTPWFILYILNRGIKGKYTK